MGEGLLVRAVLGLGLTKKTFSFLIELTIAEAFSASNPSPDSLFRVFNLQIGQTRVNFQLYGGLKAG